MSFYGERFRRDDEEDIWEELRQMLLNAPSEEEQWLNKKREQEYVDKILTRAFGEEKPAVKKKPYLTIEELMEGVKEKPQINTPIAPPQKAMPLKLTENVQIKGIIPDGGFKGATNHIRNNVEDILKKSPTKMKNLDSSYDVRKKDLTFEEKIIDKTLQNEVIRNVFPVSADMYTDARTDFSRARLNKNATILENMDSLESKTIDALIKYGVKPDERGVYYNSDSDASKKFGKSNELKRAFDKNYQDIKKVIL